jgi:hypothetical protein
MQGKGKDEDTEVLAYRTPMLGKGPYPSCRLQIRDPSHTNTSWFGVLRQ